MWIFLTLLSAFCVATNDALAKDLLKTEHELKVAWIRMGWAAPFLLLMLPFAKWPDHPYKFFLVLSLSLPLELIAFVLYNRALRLSPLSLTLPFLAFTPVILILTSWLFLGERINLAGFTGICLVCLGGYILNIENIKHGLLAPIAAIFKEKGSRLMLLVALIYSFTATFGKKLVVLSDPFFMASIYHPLAALLLLPLPLAKAGWNPVTLLNRKGRFILIGFIQAVEAIAHFNGVRYVEIAYMISLKRLSIIIGLIYGRMLFNEKMFPQRLIGAAVMLAGTTLIVWRSLW